MVMAIGGAAAASQLVGGLTSAAGAGAAGSILGGAGNTSLGLMQGVGNQGLGIMQNLFNEIQGMVQPYASGVGNAGMGLLQGTPGFGGSNGAIGTLMALMGLNTTVGDYNSLANSGSGLSTISGDPNSFMNPAASYLLKPFNPTMQDVENTPGYQFRLNQGLQATQNSFAAQGLASSGSALKGAADYSTGLAQSTWQQDYQNDLTNRMTMLGMLTGLIGQGTGTLAQAGQLGNQFGQVGGGILGGGVNALVGATGAGVNAFMGGQQGLAAGTMGAANAIGSGISGAGSTMGNYTLLQNLINNANSSSGTITPGNYNSTVSPLTASPLGMYQMTGTGIVPTQQ